MDALSHKTKFLSQKAYKKDWLLVDAQKQTVGRLASRIAYYLRGKHKPYYTPHMDCGDCVVVVNAAKVHFTGRKWNKKQYVRHTGYPGGQRHTEAQLLHEKHPTRVLEQALRGMLGKNRLGREQFRNFYAYPGSEHPHSAQNPVPLA